MLFRRAALVATALLLAGLTGCADAPEATPTPTPTGFASEEEAFAAAEETYRAYIDATNAIQLDEPETFERLYAITTGEEYASQRENLSQMHAEQWTVSGETLYSDFDAIDYDAQDQSVVARVCVDVSAVEVVDVAGKSVVSEARPDRQAVEVTFRPAKSMTGLAVALSSRIESPSCTG